MVDMETLMKVAEHSFAMPLARLVLPVPGGPYSSTPLPSGHGQLRPYKWKQVSRQMNPVFMHRAGGGRGRLCLVYLGGWNRGHC